MEIISDKMDNTVQTYDSVTRKDSILISLTGRGESFGYRLKYHYLCDCFFNTMVMIADKYLSYYKRIIKLGLPILIGQLGMIAVGFADNIMVGQHSTPELAAASFVNNLFNVVLFMCIGFTYGLTPLIGALAARGKKNEIGRTLYTGLKVNLVFSVVVTAIMFGVYTQIDHIVKEDALFASHTSLLLDLPGRINTGSNIQCFFPVELCYWKYRYANSYSIDFQYC